MLARVRFLLILVLVGATLVGCQATRTAGEKVVGAIVGATCFLGNAVLDGLLEPIETVFERETRQKSERRWKQHWRDHPNEVPAMTEKYKDDFE